VMHRDLFSAYLARYVNEDELSLQDALSEYPGMETSLQEAWQRYQQSANRVSNAESRMTHSPVERLSCDFENANQIGDLRRSGRKVS
jgi:hypothetical protein